MWHISINDTQQGPFDESQISRMIASGEANGNSLVWSEGMADWTPLNATRLAGLLGPAAPLSQAPAYNPYQPPRSNPVSPGAYQQPAVAMGWSQILWSFKGRIPRRQYWAGIGIWIGIIAAVALLTAALDSATGGSEVAWVGILIVLIPYIWSVLALQAKRWHDRGKSSAMILINLIPYIGGIWAFIECGCLRGTEGTNQYGGDPT